MTSIPSLLLHQYDQVQHDKTMTCKTLENEYTEELFMKLLEMLTSGESFAYLAARQLSLYAFSANFVSNAKNHNLCLIVFSLLRIPYVPLRFELLSLLDTIMLLDNALELFRDSSPLLVRGFETLIDLLCLPLFKESLSKQSHKNQCVFIFQQERLCILRVLNRCVCIASIRSIFRKKAFGKLFVKVCVESSTNECDAVPLIETLSKCESITYRSILAVLEVSE